MSGVSFEKSVEILPAYCAALVQSSDDLAALGAAIHEIAGLPAASDAIRARMLGLELLKVFGLGVHQAAVKDLGAEIMN